jgi:hypothetical protein
VRGLHQAVRVHVNNGCLILMVYILGVVVGFSLHVDHEAPKKNLVVQAYDYCKLTQCTSASDLSLFLSLSLYFCGERERERERERESESESDHRFMCSSPWYVFVKHVVLHPRGQLQ